MRAWSIRAGVILGAIAVAPAVVSGCACEDTSSASTEGAGASSGQGGSGGEGGTLFPTGGGGTGGCQNLECQQVQCGNGATTTVTGTVFEPGGKVPLYNVTVYVPNAPLNDIPDGASCDQCAASLSGDPVVAALTDTQGRFVLENVPVGENIPLVIQVGKWRRELVLPVVQECVDNPTVEGEVRLPRNKAEGHIPLIALTTGGADPLECLIRKIGIDDAEFTAENGAGRVHLFAGMEGSTRFSNSLNNGELFTPTSNLWGTLDNLMRYDVVLLACEGAQYAETKPEESLAAMHEYASAGGRVFASHWHNYWLEHAPAPWPDTATWDHQNDPPEPFTGLIDETFPKGQALSEWLVNVGASTTPGEMDIQAPQHTVASVNTEYSTRWIYSESPQIPGVQYFTFNTPADVPADQQCGRVVYSDIHVSQGDSVGEPFPEGCNTPDLTPQEKALLFMLFDLSACITPDDEPPPPPDIQ
jgi:hypothetical protein